MQSVYSVPRIEDWSYSAENTKQPILVPKVGPPSLVSVHLFILFWIDVAD